LAFTASVDWVGCFSETPSKQKEKSMFAKGMEQDAAEKKHMTCTQAAQIARDAAVKKMALIHYSPRYTDHDLKQLLKDAQEIFPNTVLSKDRMVETIEYTD